jgi:ABC-type nitrate/sulfonate/bicarbonate transport system substrate-binding protein
MKIVRRARILIAASIASFFLLSNLPAQEKPMPEKVRIAIATSSMAFLVPFVAKDRGLYAKHGSEVELIQMRPNISVAALLSGEIEYIELIGSAIRSAARGLPMRAISTGIKSPFFSIVAQNKYKSVKDLKGAVIGITSIGETHALRVAVASSDGGEPVPTEHDEVRWLAAGELDEVDWLEPDRPFLAELSGLLNRLAE